jgi:hypothetical protein
MATQFADGSQQALTQVLLMLLLVEVPETVVTFLSLAAAIYIQHVY